MKIICIDECPKCSAPSKSYAASFSIGFAPIREPHNYCVICCHCRDAIYSIASFFRFDVITESTGFLIEMEFELDMSKVEREENEPEDIVI